MGVYAPVPLIMLDAQAACEPALDLGACFHACTRAFATRITELDRNGILFVHEAVCLTAKHLGLAVVRRQIAHDWDW